jgi:hypothetical protein
MISILKIIGVVLWSLVLCLSLSDIAQAIQRMEPDPSADRKGGQPNLVKCDEETRQGIETIKGGVLTGWFSSVMSQDIQNGDCIRVKL